MAAKTREEKTPLELQGYGEPWDQLTEEEQARQRGEDVYASSDREWMGTDLPGRRNPDNLVDAGPHEAVPGRPHGPAPIPDDDRD